jgi:hypothetical protein
MQWIVIVLGLAAIVFFQFAMLIYVAPAIAVGLAFFFSVKVIFGLKEGSVRLIVNGIVTLLIIGYSFWFILVNSPAGKKLFD